MCSETGVRVESQSRIFFLVLETESKSESIRFKGRSRSRESESDRFGGLSLCRNLESN